jgi:hypothetical protein
MRLNHNTERPKVKKTGNIYCFIFTSGLFWLIIQENYGELFMKLMRYFVLMFLLCGVCFGADISTVDQLFSAFQAGGTYTIAEGTYDISTKDGTGANLQLNVASSVDLTMTLESSATTHAIITGNDLFDIRMLNKVDNTACVVNISGLDDSRRIRFIEGDTATVYVTAPRTGTFDLTFNYCDFSEDAGNNGLVLAEPLGNVVNITCNNCKAENNFNDGFALGSTATGNNSYMYLNDCEASGHTTTTSSDGATAHVGGQFLVINGGEYHGNSNGVHVIGDLSGFAAEGASCFVKGNAEFYDNDYGIFAGPTVGTTNTQTIQIDEAKIYNINSGGYGVYFNCFGPCVVRRCDIEGNVLANAGIVLGDRLPSSITVDRCNVYGFTKSGGFGLDTLGGDGTLDIINSTFYNNDTHVQAQNNNANCVDTIFSDAVVAAWDSVSSGNFYSGGISEYNDFWNNTADFTSGNDSLAVNDLAVNPVFSDPANDVFSLQVSSPLINSGKPTSSGGKTTIGAWQPEYKGNAGNSAYGRFKTSIYQAAP